VVDSNVLPYCSIDGKVKKSIGEMEQEFLQALQARSCFFLLLFLFYKILLVFLPIATTGFSSCVAHVPVTFCIKPQNCVQR
jgi:hypothetical protein